MPVCIFDISTVDLNGSTAIPVQNYYGNSFTGLSSTFTSNNGITTVTISWTSYTWNTPGRYTDGFGFGYITNVPYRYAKSINVKQFGGIPLIGGGTDNNTISSMSYGAFSNFNGTITATDVPTITNTSMEGMFANSKCANYGNVGAWDVSNVVNMNGMCGDSSFNVDISGWNTSKVVFMQGMFLRTSFNQPIGNWNTSNVIDMESMFYGATSFNQDIGKWNTLNSLGFHQMFYNATSFNQPSIAYWNFSKSSTMYQFITNSGMKLENCMTFFKILNDNPTFSLISLDLNIVPPYRPTDSVFEISNNILYLSKNIGKTSITQNTIYSNNINKLYLNGYTASIILSSQILLNTVIYTDTDQNKIVFVEDVSNTGINIAINDKTILESIVPNEYTYYGIPFKRYNERQTDNQIYQLILDASKCTVLKQRYPSAVYFSIDSYSELKYYDTSNNWITATSSNIRVTTIPISTKIQTIPNNVIEQLKKSSTIMKSLGYSAKDLFDASYSTTELKDASYSVFDVKSSGYTPSQLLSAFTEAELTQTFVFDISTVDLNNSTQIPLVNSGGSFLDYNETTITTGSFFDNNNGTSTVSISWAFYKNEDSNDGLSFNTSVVPYGNSSSINIKKFDGIPLRNMDSSANASFYDFKGQITATATDVPTLPNTGLAYCFANSTSTNFGNIDNWDTSNITNMSNMFNGAINFNQSINNWNTVKVTNMSNMFYGATTYDKSLNFTEDILSSGMYIYNRWNVSNVTNMSNMFNGAINFNANIRNWNTSKVTNMSNMFCGAIKFNQVLDTSTNSYITFTPVYYGHITIINYYRYWDVSNVQTMNSMFNGATVFNQPLPNWNTGNVTDMSGMFFNDASFSQQSIGNWNYSKITGNNINNFITNTAYLLDNMFSLLYLFVYNTTITNIDLKKIPPCRPVNLERLNRALTLKQISLENNTFYKNLYESLLLQNYLSGYTIQITYNNNTFIDTFNGFIVNDNNKNQIIFLQDNDILVGSNLLYGTDLDPGNGVDKIFDSSNSYISIVGTSYVINSIYLSNIFGFPSIKIENNNVFDNNNNPLTTTVYIGTASVPSELFNRFKYTATYLRTQQFSVSELRSVGYSVPDFRTAGYTSRELRTAGYIYYDLKSFYSDAELKLSFIFSIPTSQIGTDINTIKCPIVNNASFKDNQDMLVPTTPEKIDISGNNSIVTWSWYDYLNLNVSDGLSLNTSYVSYGPSCIILQFDGIPLPNMTSENNASFRSFGGINGGKILATDVPSLPNTKLDYCFYNASNYQYLDSPLVTGNIGNWNTSNITSMNRTFSDSAFNSNIDKWDVSKVTNMSALFNQQGSNWPKYNQPLISWDTSELTNTELMFAGSNFNQDIGTWITSKVTNMQYMFFANRIFNKSIGTWDTSKVTNMNRMLSEASEFNGDISGWNTSNVTSMEDMFSNARKFNQNIGSWDTSKVTNMQGMFYNAYIFNQPIGNWNTSNVLYMSGMFQNANAFNQNIGSWITNNVTSMIGMFGGATNFNQPINNWNTSNVTTMNYMFNGATNFNQPLNTISDEEGNINGWNVSNVQQMVGMFYYARMFNQDLHNWNTRSVSFMDFMFQNASEFNGNVTNWIVRNSLQYMFENAPKFNHPSISTWNFSNVTYIDSMFKNATSFNQPIGNWNTVNVNNMTNVFNNATSFNQDLSTWNTYNVTNFYRMFYNASNFNHPYIGNWNFRNSGVSGIIENGGYKLDQVYYFLKTISLNPTANNIALGIIPPYRPAQLNAISSALTYKNITYTTNDTYNKKMNKSNFKPYTANVQQFPWFPDLVLLRLGIYVDTDRNERNTYQTDFPIVYVEDLSNVGVNIMLNDETILNSFNLTKPGYNWPYYNRFIGTLEHPVHSLILHASGCPTLKALYPRAIYFWIFSYVSYAGWPALRYFDISGNWIYEGNYISTHSHLLSTTPISDSVIHSIQTNSIIMKSLGYSAKDLFYANYYATELKDASYSVLDVKSSGYVFSAIKSVYTEAELTQTFVFDIPTVVLSNSTQIPLVNSGRSFLDYNGTTITTGSTVDNNGTSTVSISWAFYKNEDSNDGLSFNTSVVPYGNSSSINIKKFDGIPLRNMDSSANASFFNFQGQITATDVPTLPNTSLAYCFANSKSTIFGNIGNWDTINVTNMSNMFYGASYFNILIDTYGDYWNLSNVTNMNGMFQKAFSFNKPLNNWYTISVTNMSNMFQEATNFDQPLNNWYTTLVTNMSGMFNGALKFNKPVDTNVTKWVISNVTDMSEMFSNTNKFDQSLNNWDTSNVTNMGEMFNGAKVFNNPINNWNTSNVTNMVGMFKGALKFNKPVNTNGNIWNVSNVTDMSGMFSGTFFDQSLNSWNTSNVTNMSNMFSGDVSFNQPINNWNTSNVTNMSGMFSGTIKFNQSINNWNTSNVTNMSNMFYNDICFNQPINWNTSNVTNMSNMFNGAVKFNQSIDTSGNIWNVSNVTDMNGMFSGTFFDQSLNNWNTLNVTNMKRMFYGDANFNKSLSNWNTSNVTDMSEMFFGVSKYRYPIGNWDYSKIQNVKNMITNTGYTLNDVSMLIIELSTNDTIVNNPNINYNNVMDFSEIPPYRALDYNISTILATRNIIFSSIYDSIIDKSYLEFYNITIKNSSFLTVFTGTFVVQNNIYVTYLEDSSNIGINIISSKDYALSSYTYNNNTDNNIAIDVSNIPSLKTANPSATKFLISGTKIYQYIEFSLNNTTRIGSVIISPIDDTNKTFFNRLKYKIPYMKVQGFNPRELNTAGYSRQELLDSSYMLVELLSGGYDLSGIANSFVFDISNSDYTTIYEPVVNNGNSFYDTATDISINSNITTLSYYWKTYTDLSGNDGLVLNPNKISYGYAPSINIRKFGGIPLRYMDSSMNGVFAYFRGQITATDSPTFPNSSLDYCFYRMNTNGTINMTYWDISGVTSLAYCFGR